MKFTELMLAVVTVSISASAWGQVSPVAPPAGPVLVGPAQMYAPVAQPVPAYYATTATPLYPPVTLWNWWRPRPVVGYYVGSTMAPPSVIAARPVVAAPPVAAYYPPVAANAPTTAYFPPATSNAPVTAYYPGTVSAPPVAPAPAVAGPTVVYRPIVAPTQAYLYSRGPLGFPRVDPIPAPVLVPVIIP